MLDKQIVSEGEQQSGTEGNRGMMRDIIIQVHGYKHIEIYIWLKTDRDQLQWKKKHAGRETRNITCFLTPGPSDFRAF